MLRSLQDYNTVVDFFLRTMFAKRTQLGYDGTMTRLPALSSLDQSVVYDIEVRDHSKTPVVKKYRTRRLISELGAIPLRGRGTRVWEVVELDTNDNPAGTRTWVLKDTWGDADRPLEGENLQKLRRKAAAINQGERFNTYFMSTSRYGHVYDDEGENARPDTTASFRLSRLDSPELPLGIPTLRVAVNPEHRALVMTRQGPIATEGSKVEVEHARYPIKIHHRIIYNEVGKLIFQAKSLRKAFQCIGDVLQGE